MSTEIQKRPSVAILDTANEPATIRLGRAIKAAIKSGICPDSIRGFPEQETVGRFLKQHNAKAISSAMIKRNADQCLEEITKCDVEIAALNAKEALTEEEEERKLKWTKAKSIFLHQYHLNARAFEKIAGKELAQAEAERPRTPSFPQNANVSAPVMAQQVNVVVHQHKEE